MSYIYLPVILCDAPRCLRRYRMPFSAHQVRMGGKPTTASTRGDAAKKGWVVIPSVLTNEKYTPPKDLCPRHAGVNHDKE